MIFEKIPKGGPLHNFGSKNFFLRFDFKTMDYDEKATNINFLSDFDLHRLYFKGSMSKMLSKWRFLLFSKAFKYPKSKKSEQNLLVKLKILNSDGKTWAFFEFWETKQLKISFIFVILEIFSSQSSEKVH
jgi:hypothetical protein